jgi:hypothetical protein
MTRSPGDSRPGGFFLGARKVCYALPLLESPGRVKEVLAKPKPRGRGVRPSIRPPTPGHLQLLREKNGNPTEDMMTAERGV